MEIVLEVPDKDAARVLELIRGIKKVRVKSIAATPLTPANIDFLADLKQSIEDVKRYQRGEIELPTLAATLAELDAEEQVERETKEAASTLA